MSADVWGEAVNYCVHHTCLNAVVMTCKFIHPLHAELFWEMQHKHILWCKPFPHLRMAQRWLKSFLIQDTYLFHVVNTVASDDQGLFSIFESARSVPVREDPKYIIAFSHWKILIRVEKIENRSSGHEDVHRRDIPCLSRIIQTPNWVTHICVSKLTIFGSDNGLTTIHQNCSVEMSADVWGEAVDYCVHHTCLNAVVMTCKFIHPLHAELFWEMQHKHILWCKPFPHLRMAQRWLKSFLIQDTYLFHVVNTVASDDQGLFSIFESARSVPVREDPKYIIAFSHWKILIRVEKIENRSSGHEEVHRRDIPCLSRIIQTPNWVTHICVSNLTIFGSDNGLSPGTLLIWPLRTKFNEILIKIHTFSFKKMHLKMASGKWRPFCLCLNVLNHIFNLKSSVG